VTHNEDIQAALKRKQEIDALGANQEQFVKTHRWLIEAVELLLRIQIEKEMQKQRGTRK
jgi:hypothetical protein